MKYKNNIIKRKNIGFTLAEVLITLVIIGIIAAVTVPVLNAEYQKEQTVTRLKKVYSELAQAVKLSTVSNGPADSWNYQQSDSNFFKEYIVPSLLKISDHDINDVRNKTITYYELSGREETGLEVMKKNGKIYNLNSGGQIIVSSVVPTNTKERITIYVDLNGERKPNRFGRDLFRLELLNDGTLIFFQRELTESSLTKRSRQELLNGTSANSFQCNKNYRGMWCGAIIQMDGWKISKDYPW